MGPTLREAAPATPTPTPTPSLTPLGWAWIDSTALPGQFIEVTWEANPTPLLGYTLFVQWEKVGEGGWPFSNTYPADQGNTTIGPFDPLTLWNVRGQLFQGGAPEGPIQNHPDNPIAVI